MKTINKSFTIIAIIIIVTIKSYSQQCTTCAGTTVTGITPSAIGTNTKATANYSFAAGYGSEATQQTAIALGHFAKANGIRSISIGENCVSNSQGYSFGQNAKALGSQSLAIGRFVETDVYTGFNSIVIGSGTDQCILKNGIGSSLMVGFNSTVPTLFVGPSKTYPASFNGTGFVGIGTSDPTQKLDIDGNIRLRNNAIIGTWSSNSLTFNTNSAAQMTIAATGQIGVGTTTPTQKLDIDGNIRLRNDGIIGTWSSNSLTFNTNSTARMTIAPTGLIGVGTSIPTEKLDVDGNIRLRNNSAIGTWSSNSLTFNTNSTARMTIAANGNVGIGVATPEYKLHIAGDAKFDSQVFINSGGLYVNGEVKAKKYLATISPFPDYVFEPGYKLLTLAEVENFINENGHLPEIPNAANVEKNGVELGEMNALLLKKIEELTLYLIEQDKKIAELQNVIKNSSK